MELWRPFRLWTWKKSSSVTRFLFTMKFTSTLVIRGAYRCSWLHSTESKQQTVGHTTGGSRKNIWEGAGPSSSFGRQPPHLTLSDCCASLAYIVHFRFQFILCHISKIVYTLHDFKQLHLLSFNNSEKWGVRLFLVRNSRSFLLKILQFQTEVCFWPRFVLMQDFDTRLRAVRGVVFGCSRVESCKNVFPRGTSYSLVQTLLL